MPYVVACASVAYVVLGATRCRAFNSQLHKGPETTKHRANVSGAIGKVVDQQWRVRCLHFCCAESGVVDIVEIAIDSQCCELQFAMTGVQNKLYSRLCLQTKATSIYMRSTRQKKAPARQCFDERMYCRHATER